MINGVLKHCTKTEVDKTYTDTHGQSVIGFAFTHLLGFDLLPRIKGINKQKLCLPDKNSAYLYPNIKSIIKGSIDWQLIIEQYDEIVKYASALKHGTAETDVIIKRFTKGNHDSPVYKALFELGKAVKTIFLCRYLMSEELRIEINESLNIVERVNGIMNFIFYGKLGEVSTNKSEDQELAILCLHLLQTCIVYINTLMIQEVLSDPEWFGILKEEDLRALSPLINIHINPYGLFPLDFSQRIKIHREETEDKQSVTV
jgi:TnpA family transposase